MGSRASKNLRYAIASTELGQVLLAVSEKGAQYLSFGPDVDSLEAGLEDFSAGSKLDISLESSIQTIIQNVKLGIQSSIPLDPVGTDFQKQVWTELQKIPASQTITYAELASRIGNPKAVRAAASACGANNLAILIPCHRVIGSTGELTGFRWGIDVKRKLLEWEGRTFGQNNRLMNQNDLLLIGA